MSSGTGYFDQVSAQLEATVGAQMSGVVSGASANAEAGVSPSVNALDTGLKAATALGSLADNVSEAAVLPVLGALGMKGQACLPISKQLDPVIGVDIHLVNIPPATSVPMPHPYVGTLLCPQDFMTAAVASYIPPPHTAEETGDADSAKLAEIGHTALTMAVGMMGATVKSADSFHVPWLPPPHAAYRMYRWEPDLRQTQYPYPKTTDMPSWEA